MLLYECMDKNKTYYEKLWSVICNLILHSNGQASVERGFSLNRQIETENLILHLRSIFARHGIPETVVSDNGPQYASYEFARFASEEGFTHVTSSPRYPQSNGKAERTVQTVKAMLKKSVDPYGALLAYRTTSLECGYSPAQLLMGRQLRTSIPVMASTLQPRWAESKQLRDRQEKIKTRQTVDYDRYHRAQPLSTLSAGDPVWVQDAKIGSQNG